MLTKVIHKQHHLNNCLIAGDAEKVMRELLLRDECHDILYDDLIFSTSNEITLDPGGMLNTAEENKTSFTLDGVKFVAYWDKIGKVLDNLKTSEEWAEGYQAFPSYGEIVILPTELAKKLEDQLWAMAFTEEANAQVEKDKNMRRAMMEAGILAEPDEHGIYRTGPGSSAIIR